MFHPIIFVLLAVTVAWGQTVTEAECWFDTDPGEGNGYALAIADSDTTVFDGVVPTAGLDYGLHRFYVRYREDNGTWGQPDGRYFYSTHWGGREVHGAEAFFDTDPGKGNGYQISFTSGDTATFLIPIHVTGLTKGLHTLYVRYRNGASNWGEPDGELFWVSNYAGRVLTAAECFFDNDPGKGNGIPLAIPQGQVTDFVGEVPTAGLYYGLHRFYIRYRESNGVWGAPDGEFFYSTQWGGRRLHSAEYFFDNDPGKGNGIPITVMLDDTTDVIMPLSVDGLQPGLHRFYIRYLNGVDFWGEPNGAFFYIPTTPGDGHPDQATLSGAEYYVNWDPGEGNGQPILPSDGVWDEPIEQIDQMLGEFPAGRYWLGIRYRDSAGLWSNLVTDTFYVSTRAVIKAVGNNITLWWDSEPGTLFSVFRAPVFEGVAVAVGSSTTGTLTDVGIVNAQDAGYYIVTQSDTNFTSLRIPPENVTRQQ